MLLLKKWVGIVIGRKLAREVIAARPARRRKLAVVYQSLL
jgi:hypothetical protein